MSMTAPWVVDAIEVLSLGDQVRLLGEPGRSDVLRAVTGAFLQRPGELFWEAHLKSPTVGWATEDGFLCLPQIAPDPEGRCWLIAGLTDSDDEKAIFECTPTVASALIGECPGFAYALVDPALQWIVIENDHDILIATGEAGERVARIRR
jgi:hypothetical protein